MPPGAKLKYDQKYLKKGVKGHKSWSMRLKKQLLYDVYFDSKSKLWIPWTTSNCLIIMSVLKDWLIYEKGLF